MENAGTEAKLRAAFRMKEIPGLDAMRAAAIVLVVSYHLGVPVSGGLGVTVFFVLSGFLITRLLLAEVTRTDTISVRNFYKRRTLRIFPAFYLCWLVTAIVMLLQHQPILWKQAAASFLYLADYARAALPHQENFYMGLSWSLAIEEQFYLLWPMALLWIIRKHHSVSTVLSVAIVSVVLWRAVLMFRFGVGWGYIYNAFDTRADALLIGCWLAALLQRRRAFGVSWALHSRWLVLIPILALALCSRIDLSQTATLNEKLTAFTVEPAFSGLLLLQLMLWGSAGWRFLEHGAVKLVARLSYSIYLYHPLVLNLTRFVPIPRPEGCNDSAYPACGRGILLPGRAADHETARSRAGEERSAG